MSDTTMLQEVATGLPCVTSSDLKAYIIYKTGVPTGPVLCWMKYSFSVIILILTHIFSSLSLVHKITQWRVKHCCGTILRNAVKRLRSKANRSYSSYTMIWARQVSKMRLHLWKKVKLYFITYHDAGIRRQPKYWQVLGSVKKSILSCLGNPSTQQYVWIQFSFMILFFRKLPRIIQSRWDTKVSHIDDSWTSKTHQTWQNRGFIYKVHTASSTEYSCYTLPQYKW